MKKCCPIVATERLRRSKVLDFKGGRPLLNYSHSCAIDEFRLISVCSDLCSGSESLHYPCHAACLCAGVIEGDHRREATVDGFRRHMIILGKWRIRGYLMLRSIEDGIDANYHVVLAKAYT